MTGHSPVVDLTHPSVPSPLPSANNCPPPPGLVGRSNGDKRGEWDDGDLNIEEGGEDGEATENAGGEGKKGRKGRKGR